MKHFIENRKHLLQQIARTDQQYTASYVEFLEAEKDYFELLMELTEQQQDRLWKFVNLSNEVDERLLEIACGYMMLS